MFFKMLDFKRNVWEQNSQIVKRVFLNNILCTWLSAAIKHCCVTHFYCSSHFDSTAINQ